MNRFAAIRAVLFDLDGTLADTAPDLAAAANAMRVRRGLAPLPLSALRPVASRGARGLLEIALDASPAQADYESLRTEFLDLYAQNLHDMTRPFDGVENLLSGLERKQFLWAIVTNKPARFTLPLVQHIGWATRAGTVVSGDTAAYPKPHPAPLQYAATQLGLDADACLYVGDDRRDVEAARAAGMPVVAAAYGYCDGGDPVTWGADALIHAPLELLDLMGLRDPA